MGAFNTALAHALPLMPRALVGLVARRYVAGTTLEDALACVEALEAEGACATVDVLGENTTRAEDAEQTRDAYISALKAIAARKLDANISVKLTALGLKIDFELCRRNLVALCEEAAASGNFVRIDMEDSSCTQATLDLHERIRREHANVGVVLQAALRRTLADARRLAASRANVRLCKGIYIEPPDVAWRDREMVRRNFTAVLRELLAGGCHVGVATHDEVLVREALRLAGELGIGRDRFELQMLLGVAPALRRQLLGAGHRLRVYIPYGERWYEYSLRRLKENPEIAGHVLRAMLRRG
jgi:proline dehydrogenase